MFYRKRHMENPNIHNIPYVRSRDQKRWKGHAKKVVSKEETTERMRKWRAENREKNRQNDLRCRVYRLARQKFGDQDSVEKHTFIRDEIIRRLGRRINAKSNSAPLHPSTSPIPTHQRLLHNRYRHSFVSINPQEDEDMKDEIEEENEIEDEEDEIEDDEDQENRVWKSELPFYNLPHQKIELPSIDTFCPPLISSTNLRRRTSSSSESSISTADDASVSSSSSSSSSNLTLPPVHSFFYPSYRQPLANSTGIKYVKNTKILDEFVGVVLDYAQDDGVDHHNHRPSNQ
ncbi:hypothetical protein [Absidia glauca]|uniref:DUF3020 domain-containing protein n=1 Tax=Absidia glauca TaxID=4829 RepID=A0A163K9I7_ABSGL|nr:hypothetical protein [Absidia glauca]